MRYKKNCYMQTTNLRIKKYRHCFSGLILGFSLLILGGINSFGAQKEEAEPEDQNRFTIAVGTDIHLDPENLYAGMVNPLVMYNMEIADALIWDAKQQGAVMLLLCGDITNGGRRLQHEALVEKLRNAEENGLPVYVLPGNHDIGDIEAGDFAQLYEEFGFQEAYGRDKDSLSYSILLDDYMILMLDTDGYSGRTSGAYISEVTMRWIRTQLELARRNHWQVLTAGHYSMLTGQTTEFNGQQAMIDLLKEYEVPLYLCGHLHQRHVAVDEPLTELVVEQLTAYPCGYALLYQEGVNAYRYEPQRIDVEAWAEQTGQTKEELLHFDDLAQSVSSGRSEEIIEILRKDRSFPQEYLDEAVEFFSIMLESYADGTMYYHLEELYSHPGYKAFMDIAQGTTYEKWIPIILAGAVPYTVGFEVKENQISLLP